jgi:DNA-binding response OmpR family regulator
VSKILIVEDEKPIGDLERDYLEINGYEVDVETNGELGLKNALKNDYDLIILDIMLPGMDGFEICKRIRVQKDVPIIMVSAKKEDIDKIRGLGLGADDYITKPFSPGELVARVKAHISRYERLISTNDGGKSQNDEIRIGGITIENISRSVDLNGKSLALTAKEYDLLLFLASNPNRVFTKEQLFEHVWGMDSFGDIATVIVHIKKLRQKIEVNSSEPKYIETIWGVGYKFKA